MMAYNCQVFTVLYTHQKTKKSKVWQDGILKTSPEGNKATLYDDKWQCLESVFLKVNKLNPGDDLESERYLITVEAEDVHSSVSHEQIEVKEAPKFNRNALKPVGLRPPAGLKRKFTGFQGPREIPKKPAVEGIGGAASPVLAQGCSSLPSQLYTTSPLFAAPCRKQEEVCLPADYGADASGTWTKQNASVTSFSTCSSTEMVQGENIAGSFLGARKTEGGSISQNIRSTAQILALLKFQPPPLMSVGISANVGQQHHGQQSANGSSQNLKSKCTGTSGKPINLTVESQKTLQYPLEKEVVKSVPNRSRWDVYLEQSPVSNTEGVVNKSQEITIGTNVPDDRQCCLSPVELLLSSKQEEEKGAWDSKRVHFPIQTNEADGAANLLKTERQLPKDLGVSNSHQRSARPLITLAAPLLSKSEAHLHSGAQQSFVAETNVSKSLGSSLNSTFQSFNYLQSSKVISSFENCANQKVMDQSVVNSQNLPTPVIPSCSISSTNRLGRIRCLDGETPQTEKPVASYSPAHNNEFALLNDIDNDDFSEVSFNLLDNFEFEDSGGEDSQGGPLVPQSASQVSKRCWDLNKDPTGSGHLGELSVKQDQEKCAKNNLSGNDSLPLKTQDKKDREDRETVEEAGSLLPITKNVPEERSISSTDWQATELAFTSTDLTPSPVFDIIPLGSGKANKVKDDSVLQTLSKTMDINDTPTFNNEYCSTSVHSFLRDRKATTGESKLTSCSLGTNSPSTEQISEGDSLLLGYREEEMEEGHGKRFLEVLGSSNPSLQESPLSSDELFEGVTEEPQPPMIGKRHDALIEDDMQLSEEGIWCKETDNDSPELPESGSSISLLKTLTEHSTAVESLNILKGKNLSTFREGEGIRERDLHSGEDLQRRSTGEIYHLSPELHHPSPELYHPSPELYHPSPELYHLSPELYQVPPSFTAESTWRHSEDMQKSLCPQPVSPELVPLIFQEQPFGSVSSNGPSKSCQAVQPVEFQGHRVKGSASSAVMIRASDTMLEWRESPVRSPHGNLYFESSNHSLSPQQPTSCMLIDFMQPSTICAEEDACFGSNKNFETVSDLSPVPHDRNNSISTVACRLPQRIGDTQESDRDWELSQWSSREPNQVKPPTQHEMPSNLDCPFFLRPRHEDTGMLLSGVKSSDVPHRVEEFDLIEDSRASRLQFRLQRRTPIVTRPETAVCSSLKHRDCVYDTCEEQQRCSPVSESNFSRSFQMCPVKKTSDSGDEMFLGCVKGPCLLEPPENCNITAHGRPSKWSKYQNVSPSSPLYQNTKDREEANDFCAESVFGKDSNEIKERQSYNMNPPGSAHLSSLKDRLGLQNSKDTDSWMEPLTKRLATTNSTLPHMRKQSLRSPVTGDGQISSSLELCFPSIESVHFAVLPERQVKIPAVFQSSAHYKQVFTASLTEHLNILMFDLSHRLHKALSKADMSFYTSPRGEEAQSKQNCAPLCLHRQPAKLVMVKKEGPNKGRFFYTCDAPKSDQCKFFKWLEEVKSSNPVVGKSEPKVVLGDVKNLGNYIRCQRIALYEECQFMIRKNVGFKKRRFGKLKKIVDADSEFGDESKSKLYLKLSRKENSSAYSKDDIWVVSKALNFDPLDTFIACSAFFGPSANNDIEILPLKGYYPSNWPSHMVVHALLVCNASTELTTLRNIQEHFNPATLPLMPHLLELYSAPEKRSCIARGRFNPPSINVKVSQKCKLLNSNLAMDLAMEMIQQFYLNRDQATALVQIAQMMTSAEESGKEQTLPITILHGVFGAGKSYLLAVVVLFLVQLFESSDRAEGPCSSHWKLLISSSTNVAVDRVLLGLLDLGFDQFIRVGSIRKIAKPVLPYSLHAGSENESEQIKELLALLKDDLTPVEKAYVRKSIEQHKLGTNKTLLGQVRVVGATCAACPFACLSNLTFPVVVLDECSQITEPVSLLPIARFQCEKLILVGDPKQLPPTIQGSEAAHGNGLEQTLFKRLCLMGHKAIMLRTQYRCHPAISAIANELFYEGNLMNGVSDADRRPLLDWLPTLCFYNVNGTEQVEGNNSFQNVEEAIFTVKLIQSLIASGIEGSMIGVITLYKSQMYKVCF
ncbi:5'-3' DNA helicase ZGRF1 isoform X3 [Ascaphus truei]|uniref:5'-3' DNA helicase ZGRF1 isoform X3 n=1 Tax=Ascaphus truei TaxID=8439 RepID=UPI003F5A92CD